MKFLFLLIGFVLGICAAVWLQSTETITAAITLSGKLSTRSAVFVFSGLHILHGCALLTTASVLLVLRRNHQRSATRPMSDDKQNQATPALAVAPGSVLVPFFRHGPMVMLHVACNDGDNGIFSGKCEALEIQYGRDLDYRLSFSPNFFDWSPAFVVDWEQRWLQIGGLPRITYSKHGGHVGNWCWDCFEVRREDAAELIAHPKIRKWFSLDEAPTDLWEAYHGRPVADAPNTQGMPRAEQVSGSSVGGPSR